MRTLAKPAFGAREVFLECISIVRDRMLKQDLTDCTDIIEVAESDFNTKFPLLLIHEIPRGLIVRGRIDVEEMKKVYNDRMVKETVPGYKYYSALRLSAPHGKCPFCGVRGVDTLDHYLPKTLYPIYAITPINLVPSCTPCNKGKRVVFPTNDINQTLHPYYDNVEVATCIKARLLDGSNESFEYYIDCPAEWAQILKDRVHNHFDSYNLNELYSSHAGEELRGIKKQLRKLYNIDPAVLLDYLNDCYDSRLDLGRNSWQAAMYRALLENDLFTTGGVLL